MPVFLLSSAMKAIACLLLAGLLAVHWSTASAAETRSITGLWKNADATFDIFNDSGKIAARIISLREPKTPEGKPKTDIHNPDATKHDRPLIGLVFMSGFVPAGTGKWDHGTIYDPKTGNTYSCNMELEDANRLKVRGYIAISLIGRTDIWTRVQ